MDVNNSKENIKANSKERTCQQTLGVFLVDVGLLNMLEIAFKLLMRYLIPNDTMLLGGYEVYIGSLRLLIVIALFIIYLVKVKPLETHSKNVRKMLVLWGVILIPIQMINDVCVMLYARMLELIQHVFIEGNVDPDGQIFAMIYDSTHGFKYICLFLAILLGIVMTGEILEKRKLMIVSLIAAILFLIAFALLRMDSVNINNITTFEVGLNWASLVFHTLNTIGLIGIGMYIYLIFKPEAASKEG